MTESEDQFDAELTAAEGRRLGGGLRRLYGRSAEVPAVVDEAIRARARSALQKQGRARAGTRRLAWWLGGGAAAVAAAITLAVVLWPGGAGRPAGSPGQSAGVRDVNRDGAVNMLDAYVLARRVARKESVGGELDLNRDGVIDAKDADAIARDAVALDGGVAQ